MFPIIASDKTNRVASIGHPQWQKESINQSLLMAGHHRRLPQQLYQNSVRGEGAIYLCGNPFGLDKVAMP